MNRKNTQRTTWLLLLAAGIIFLLAPWLKNDATTAAKKDIDRATSAYRQLETKLNDALAGALAQPNDSSLLRFMVQKEFREEGLYFVVYNQGVPWTWSDNRPDFLSLSPDTLQPGKLVSLSNGWYVSLLKQSGNRTAVGLILVCNNYAYQNQYLVNEMNPVLGFPEGTMLADSPAQGTLSVTANDGKEAFRVRIPGASARGNLHVALWQGLALILVIVALFRIQRLAFARGPAYAWLFIGLLLVLRWLMISMRWPSVLYEMPFFSPQLYASSFWFNSPGDLLLNALLALMVAYGFARPAQEKTAQVPDFLLLLAYAAAAIPLNSLVSGLVLNSRIIFDVSNLFEMNAYTVAGLFIVVLAVLAYFLFARGIVYRLRQSGSGWKRSSFLFLIAIAVTWLSAYLLKSYAGVAQYFSWIDVLFSASLLALQLVPGTERRFSLNFFLLNILLFSLYAAAMLHVFNQRKELESRRVLVQKLQANQDSIAEYLFDDVQRNISADKELKRMLADATTGQEQLTRRVSRLYLSGYWTRYETTITGIRKSGAPFDTLTGWSFDQALQYIKDHGVATSNNYLYSVSQESGRLSYVSMVPILDHDTTVGHLLVRLDEKLMQLPEGFPELFISSKAGLGKQAGSYSYARYTNGKLTYQLGDFSYFFSLRAFGNVPVAGGQVVSNLDGYSHLIANITPGNYLVISRMRDNPLLLFTLFSYIASVLSLSAFAWYAVMRLRKRRYRFSMSLKKRIQVAVLALVVLSVLLIGGGTISFLVKRYDDSQAAQIRSRVNNLSLAIENLMKRRQLLPMPDDETRISLNLVSTTRSVDFNLYALEGYLLFSTQPKVFEQGIVSRLMNPEVLLEFIDLGRTGCVHPESIGRLNYVAAYEPIRDQKGNIVAYLSLPYFEKQNERNREISSFLSTLINTYVLLLALSVILALVIANRITEPLRLIQDKLGTVRLGKQGEPIVWNREDEIGELVTEYNKMVDKLEESAARLAQSERENAWREMARQVAHEIKNPLTPMKLSLQHLQKSWDDKDPRREELLERVSRTLVEQIDSLSAIATAFADFAQMPADKKDKVSLNEVVHAAVDLFDSEATPVKLQMPDYECFALADKDQLMRLVSNLIKNGLQSIPPGRKGIIDISLSEKDANYLIKVSDNGVGIPNDLKAKIFTPNFTTKSSGMGLGLSMAKRITENFGGQIWFQTEENSGSTFYVSLPKFQA